MLQSYVPLDQHLATSYRARVLESRERDVADCRYIFARNSFPSVEGPQQLQTDEEIKIFEIC